MIKFAELFPDVEILATLSQELSWSHFIEILPIKNEEARLYYAKDAAARRLGVRDLREQISRKAYERREIANYQLSEASSVPFNVFKDPYLLDVLDLKENFLETDLEKAVLTELEKFILEFGHGFTFVERQEGENEPIGVILCTKASRNQIELLELDKSGIAVAEYWTNLPTKVEFERKIKEIMHEAHERLERRRSLPIGVTQKRLNYFYEPKDDELYK